MREVRSKPGMPVWHQDAQEIGDVAGHGATAVVKLLAASRRRNRACTRMAGLSYAAGIEFQTSRTWRRFIARCGQRSLRIRRLSENRPYFRSTLACPRPELMILLTACSRAGPVHFRERRRSTEGTK
jgi:hypothetical protein